MVTWAEFAAAAPDLAAEGRRLIYRDGVGRALLATVGADGIPRIHPISVGIVDARLCAFILPSPKRVDLERDGRYALHAHQDPGSPSEFSVRGFARPVDDREIRSAAAAGWHFEVTDDYRLFECSIETALLGSRKTDAEWPPRYRSWAAGRATPETPET